MLVELQCIKGHRYTLFTQITVEAITSAVAWKQEELFFFPPQLRRLTLISPSASITIILQSNHAH